VPSLRRQAIHDEPDTTIIRTGCRQHDLLFLATNRDYPDHDVYRSRTLGTTRISFVMRSHL
jgi:hypothetical protein